MLTIYALLLLVHLDCNIFWIYMLPYYLLSYNATTSFSLCFKRNRRIKIKPLNLALGVKVIPSVYEPKYLGISNYENLSLVLGVEFRTLVTR